MLTHANHENNYHGNHSIVPSRISKKIFFVNNFKHINKYIVILLYLEENKEREKSRFC